MNYETSFWTWYGQQIRQELKWGVRVVAPPTVEPVTLAEAALHSGIDTWGSPAEYPDQALIEAMIKASRDMCERYLGRSLAPQTVMWSGHNFPATEFIELPFGPVLGIESITYNDGTGDVMLGTSSYLLDNEIEPACVYTLNGAAWPTISPRPGGVRIRYVAGYTIDGDSPNEWPLPPSLRSAILLTFGHLYENRETTRTEGNPVTEIPMGARYLMDPYRLRIGMA